MSIITTLSRELSNRTDCVQADYERLLEAGANKEALERIIKHSMEIGIIKDKLENIRIHEIMMEEDEDGNIEGTDRRDPRPESNPTFSQGPARNRGGRTGDSRRPGLDRRKIRKIDADHQRTGIDNCIVTA